MTKARSSADFAAGGPQVAGKNAIINGGMDIWQRGTSFSLAASTSYTSALTSDRWQTSTGANQAITVSRQATNDTTNLPNIQYCLRYQRNSGQTGTGSLVLAQTLETTNSIPMAGRTVTVSFYARAGANYSPTSGFLTQYLISGTGTDQNIFAGFTGSSTLIALNATLTTTWQRFTFTATVPTNSTQLASYLLMSPTGTAGANDYYEITGVQLEIGSVATPFSRAGGTIQGELAACQRYYFRSTGGSVYSTYGVGYAYGTTGFAAPVKLAVSMRVKPTSIDYSALGAGIYSVSVNALSAVTFDTTCSGFDWVMVIGTSSGLTQFRPYDLANNNNAAGYIGFNAEL